MMRSRPVRLFRVLVVGLSAAALGLSEAGAGDIKWEEGRWRLELTGYKGLHQGSRDRTDDWSATGTVEYESPLWKCATLSLRLHPLFYYDDDEAGDDIWGVGFGPALRLYSKAEERRGWFIEGGVSALFHSNRFDGNGSNVNFASELGVGYKFKSDWHVAAKWRHISNASLDEDNAGANAVGIGFGFTF